MTPHPVDKKRAIFLCTEKNLFMREFRNQKYCGNLLDAFFNSLLTVPHFQNFESLGTALRFNEKIDYQIKSGPKILRSCFLHCVSLTLGALLVPTTALSHCNASAHTKTHCNTLQRERLRAALALQYTSTHCNALRCNKKLSKMMAEMEFCHGWAPWPAARTSHTQAGWVSDQRGWLDACATKQPRLCHELQWIWCFFVPTEGIQSSESDTGN